MAAADTRPNACQAHQLSGRSLTCTPKNALLGTATWSCFSLAHTPARTRFLVGAAWRPKQLNSYLKARPTCWELLDGGPEVLVLRLQAILPGRRHHDPLQEEGLRLAGGWGAVRTREKKKRKDYAGSESTTYMSAQSAQSKRPSALNVSRECPGAGRALCAVALWRVRGQAIPSKCALEGWCASPRRCGLPGQAHAASFLAFPPLLFTAMECIRQRPIGCSND